MTDDEALDQNLKDAVRADADTVDRLVALALTAGPARRASLGRLTAAATVTAAVLTGLVLLWPAAPEAPGVIRMRNVGDVILVAYPDGSRAIIGPAKTDHTLFAGFDYILFEGEPQ